MKRKHSFFRAAAAALTVLLGLGSLWPALTTEASDLTIDGSAFRDPTITHITVYKWVEGIPSYSWSQTFGKKFPGHTISPATATTPSCTAGAGTMTTADT